MNFKYFEQFVANQAAHFKISIIRFAKTMNHLPVKSFAFLKKHYVLPAGLALLISVPLIIRSVIWYLPVSNTIVVQSGDSDLVLAQQKITRELSILDKKLNAKKPASFYLVINSASNEFALYKGNELIKKDKCSTGSYKLLKNGDGQQWMFKTPKGEFRIRGKVTAPVWKKPDWAFVEEGLPVPSSNHHTRFESGVLGDYALSLGDGYLIHGTLYQRFLGLPVTHGCIRLNDENLELVYKSLPVGSKVYIY
ncbi:L,D-transpeptidase [uncultured Draconibacterium sp.]|uniref:L,D-transpeptidase n=1 Tax=uncultured Draconibacterium sp. TaxID=1573823 RepID=UPI00321786CE